MDTRPSLFRETPPSRPSLRELIPIALPIVGAAAFLALIVAIIVLVNSMSVQVFR